MIKTAAAGKETISVSEKQRMRVLNNFITYCDAKFSAAAYGAAQGVLHSGRDFDYWQLSKTNKGEFIKQGHAYLKNYRSSPNGSAFVASEVAKLVAAKKAAAAA